MNPLLNSENENSKEVLKNFIFNNLVKTNIGVGQFTISNATNIKSVWDVTDIYNVTKLDNTQNSMSFKLALGQDKKFVAVDNLDFYTPLRENETNVD